MGNQLTSANAQMRGTQSHSLQRLRPDALSGVGAGRGFHGFGERGGADGLFGDSERVVVFFQNLGGTAEFIDLLHELAHLLFLFANHGMNVFHCPPLKSLGRRPGRYGNSGRYECNGKVSR